MPAPAAGGPQNIHPHPPPLKNVFWPEMGGGGGGAYIISPWTTAFFVRRPSQATSTTRTKCAPFQSQIQSHRPQAEMFAILLKCKVLTPFFRILALTSHLRLLSLRRKLQPQSQASAATAMHSEILASKTWVYHNTSFLTFLHANHPQRKRPN